MPPDYNRQNLRGRSFKGQNLTGANFTKADIRGADFTNAILKDADFTGANLKGTDFTGANLTGSNFSGTKAGLKFHWIFILLALSFIISSLSGFTSAIIINFNIYFWFSKRLSAIFVITYSSIFIIIVRTILNNYFHHFAITINVYLSIGVILAVAFFGAPAAAIDEPDAKLGGMALVTFTGMVFLIVIVFHQMGGLAEKLLTNIGDIKIEKIIKNFAQGEWLGGLVAGIFGAVWGYFFSHAAIEGDKKFAWIWKMCVNFTAKGGTIFNKATLTDADFTGATLKNTDFRKANLTRTRFYEAKKLDFARPGKTILSNHDVLKLLVTLNGRNKSYIGANLRGANLIGADLKEANLKNADIIEATFKEANLEWANLTLTQAIGTNFTKAHITGACVEAWNIESTTILDHVDCRFVYLLEYPKPRTDDRERRPSSGEFQPGEFTKLFEEVLNTVDLIFRNGIDWKAFITAFRKVQVENGATELVSIENKGDGVVVVKVAVPENANKEKIHSYFTQIYQLALAAVEEKYKAVLQAKDERIEDHKQQIKDIKQFYSELVNISKSLADQQTSIENKIIQEINNVNNDSSRKVEIGSIGRDFNASGQALNLGEISGTVTNTINELPSAPEPDKPGIKELLTQLKTAIEADTNLSEEDKTDALEQIKTLAEVAKNPQAGAMQKAAKTAIKILKGTISSLPTAATLVEQCSKILPLISSVLGLG
ncbi:pentapeptide repeat-containing protein [Cuspidothrix issatschenkoi]|uniref:Low-complexity protein n=1 Tax=Cuspidothrix issatschenkoi CHARLIE-1 TaxID=2052836 RepID=A0A2S6CXV2_9CYAN|nr:pentapeptide repeat-containing protein [Cuspidothrix issatschenkoi]PPJ64552.1 hypothetical protein CUN59_03980 [Cuspidothrix issatschenkoi CHARLIE-1]